MPLPTVQGSHQCQIWLLFKCRPQVIDGAYFKVRRKRISREAALCAVGITEKGQKEHLGFIQGHRESQQAWEFLLTQLVRRGLDPKGVLMVSSDGCPGITAATIGFSPHGYGALLTRNVGSTSVTIPSADRLRRNAWKSGLKVTTSIRIGSRS